MAERLLGPLLGRIQVLAGRHARPLRVLGVLINHPPLTLPPTTPQNALAQPELVAERG